MYLVNIILCAKEVVVYTEIVFEAHLLWVLLGDGLELVIVELGVRVGHTHKEPCKASELVVWDVLHEHSPEVGTVGCDSGSSGNHDVHSVGLRGQQKHLSGGSCNPCLRRSARGLNTFAAFIVLVGAVMSMKDTVMS